VELFEAKVMNRHASVPSIAAWVDQWAAFGAPRKADFERPLVYFRERYWRDGSFTPLFDGLNFRRSDRKPFVKSVLMNERQEAGDVVLALLLIVFRLRNNLFHGEKWLYEIQGQERNFESANQILITILEL
jgi:hypothetical protein